MTESASKQTFYDTNFKPLSFIAYENFTRKFGLTYKFSKLKHLIELGTRQPLWAILYRLPEKRDSRGDEREGQGRKRTRMKAKKQKK